SRTRSGPSGSTSDHPMEILVLDTIHGGADLATELAGAGHRVDMVDVYRGEQGITAEEAVKRHYDYVVAPVHLDPDHPLLRRVQARRLTHHDGVRMILSARPPAHILVEITGARGKTTTAHAIAHVLEKRDRYGRTGRFPGILHTSDGTFRYPEGELLWKKSITPASVLAAVHEAEKIKGWLVAEESLGVSGEGWVAVLTSPDDYRIAAGKRSALSSKLDSLAAAQTVVLPPGLPLLRRLFFEHPRAFWAGECVHWEGDRCTYDCNHIAGEFRNALGDLPGYRLPLTMAAAALCAIGVDPGDLASFPAVVGRLSIETRDEVLILDDSNSGTSAETARDAVSYARTISAKPWITLVIGEEDRAVCEGFPPEKIASAIGIIRPDCLILVGDRGRAVRPVGLGRRVAYADTLEAARALALRETPAGGAVVLAVKTWR
ncbi:MAG TPA: coenzyme F430 synthase, partial [Methanomicrobiales archaeon]|nr:coenzyme F430 synthase [Methanomicrobiales archaeon]